MREVPLGRTRANRCPRLAASAFGLEEELWSGVRGRGRPLWPSVRAPGRRHHGCWLGDHIAMPTRGCATSAAKRVSHVVEGAELLRQGPGIGAPFISEGRVRAASGVSAGPRSSPGGFGRAVAVVVGVAVAMVVVVVSYLAASS